MLEEYLQQYVSTFDENFPLFAFMGDEDEAIDAIKDCLKRNKPYELKMDDDVLY